MTPLVLLLSLLVGPPQPAISLAGGWTLNKDLSDQPMDGGGDRGEPPRGGRAGGGHRGGFGGGGRGGLGGGGYGRRGGMDREEMARMRDAMRDIMSGPEHLVITQTPSMIVITAPDGRTTRLSPDGTKVKDDSTKVERTTKWDGDKLVTQIRGLGRSSITESYALDSEHHQLRRMLQIEGGQGGQPRTITYIYDMDAKS